MMRRLTQQGRGPRIGLLGGTFNPVHRGHLLLADGAREALHLDQVLWIPAYIPPHKAIEGKVTPNDRARMVELAIQGHPAFRLSRVELNRPPPSYTIDTVRQLQADPAFKRATWFLMIGSDTARELPTWRKLDELRKRVTFVAIPRPGDPADKILPRGVVRLPIPAVNISSSAIRQRVRLGWEIQHLVPPAVARYIEEKALYR